ncbi:MAG: peptide deformylase [Bacteroidales bacterium]|nr:peptide deformylase [Bacteroidales bacterium]
MILPIYVYGEPVLRKLAHEVDVENTDWKPLVADMFETMYHAGGVGLAAPQIGKDIRLFVIDSEPFKESFPDVRIFKGAFINPVITEEWGEDFVFGEGCLSLPNLNEDVVRKSNIHIEYYDVDGQFHEEDFDGLVARVIQHEYDHLEGKVFVDHLSGIKKMVLKRALNDIATGKSRTSYKTVHPKK